MLQLDGMLSESSAWEQMTSERDTLFRVLRESGLVVIRGMKAIRVNPSFLVELGRFFGEPVKNLEVGTPARYLLDGYQEIFVNSNLPPGNRVPAERLKASADSDPASQYEYPYQQGWHHDQSFLAAPPIMSLLYGHTTTESGGETLYASTRIDHIMNNLHADTIALVNSGLIGCHAVAGFGRTEPEVQKFSPLNDQALVAEHPLIRQCPLTGSRSLFLSDGTQMDFIQGPFKNLSPGTTGDGATLMRRLMKRITTSSNIYAHHWKPDDILVHSNISFLHAATWYEHTLLPRVAWRVTVCQSSIKSKPTTVL